MEVEPSEAAPTMARDLDGSKESAPSTLKHPRRFSQSETRPRRCSLPETGLNAPRRDSLTGATFEQVLCYAADTPPIRRALYWPRAHAPY
eukprot:2856629-Rhodomonas_salina.2